MLSRIETMVLMGMELPLAAIRGQIASALDIIVHLGRLRDKSRKVLSIKEVLGVDEYGRIKLSSLYEFREEEEENGRISGRLEAVGQLKNQTKLADAGLILYEKAADKA